MNDSGAHTIALPMVSVAFALILGCQPGTEDATTGGAASDGEHPDAPASTAPETSDEEGSVAFAWPKSGQAVVEIKEGGIAVISNDASQLAVLEQLAKLVGFRVVLGDVVPGSLSGALVDLEVHQAVSFILTGLPYATSYAIDTSSGRHELAAVRVGAFVEVEPPADLAERFEIPQNALGAADRWHADNTSLSLQLADGDPQARAKALETLDPESNDISVLSEIVASDPDAQVRAVVIDQLYFVQSYAAIQIAVRALQDPDPRVVIASLNLIEAWHDQSLVPKIDILRQHSDAQVRVRATEVVALLEDDD